MHQQPDAIATCAIKNLDKLEKRILMQFQSIRFQEYHKHLGRRVVTFVLSLILLNTWVFGQAIAAASEANNPLSAELEAEVLQIIRTHPEAIVEALQRYRQQQQAQQKQTQQSLLKSLAANPQSLLAQSPTTGATESKLILLEFSDFQCPFCARAHTTLKEFMNAHKDEVLLAYKHLPLASAHPQAVAAAKAAWAAGQQGKFWQYHDALFSQQKQLGEELYEAIAQDLNLDLDRFNQDRQGDKAEAAIRQDLDLAKELGLEGTPTFIFNEEILVGAVPLDTLERTLSQQQQKIEQSVQ